MDKQRTVSVMSLSALRPELFRVVPALAERNEEIQITHHGRLVAVLAPAGPPADGIPLGWNEELGDVWSGSDAS